MNAARVLSALALSGAISLTLATAQQRPSASPAPGTREMIEALRQQGVSPEQIWAVDPAGVPLVCAEPAAPEAAPQGLPFRSEAAAVLPAGTRSWEAVPSVIRADGVESFRFEVDTNGPVARVRFREVSLCLVPPQPAPFELRDDGTGGDRIAGDSVYTSGAFRYDVACPIPFPAFFEHDPTSPAGIWTNGIGNVVVEELDGTENVFLIQPAVGYMRPDIPAREVRQLAPDVAASPHVVNVRTGLRATQSALRFSGFGLQGMTFPIYEVLPDAFDFLLFFSIDHVEWLPFLTRSNFNAGVHYRVQTEASGTGVSVFDNSSFYGSQGRLLSLNILDTQRRGIYSGNAMHEITHQWASFTDLSLGLADGTGHYDFRSSAASLVGGFRFVAQGNGTFLLDCDEGRNGAHRAPQLDRYMAGLIPGSEVPPLFLYGNSLPLPLSLCGQTLSEIARTVTIEEIQAVHGVRAPGPGAARRDFTVGFVAESHNRLLTPTEMTYYDILAEHFAREIPASAPDPYLGFNWVPVARFWGEGVTWSTGISLPPRAVEVAFDLKPRTCPNQVNLRSRGVTPAAVLGTVELDVQAIDPSSLRVAGVAPLRSALEDVAAPFFPFFGRDEALDCTTQGPDGRPDLTLKLDTPALRSAVQQHLGRPPRDGEVVVLPLTGRLRPERGGGEIQGEDVLVVLGKDR